MKKFLTIILFLLPLPQMVFADVFEQTTMLVPAVIEGQTIYPTSHARIIPYPFSLPRWEKIVFPQEWADKGYYVEVWDQNNRPVPGFRAWKLENSKPINLEDVDATLYSRVRFVLFTPPGTAAPEKYGPVIITFSSQTDYRLLIVGSILVILFLIFLILTIRYLTPKDLFHELRWFLTHFVPRGESFSGQKWLTSIWLIILSAGLFGAIMGINLGGMHIFYVLFKLPILLFAVLLFSCSAHLVLQNLFFAKTTLKNSLSVSLHLLVIFSLTLASLSLAEAFFTIIKAPHDTILLASLGFFLLAGLTSAYSLWRYFTLHKVSFGLFCAFVIWLGVYGLVCLQVGWMLRPWVGFLEKSSDVKPFMRLYSGNVLEEMGFTIERAIRYD